MKKSILIIAALMVTMGTKAQSGLKRDSLGNFYQVDAVKELHDSTTTYTAKLNSHEEEPVYQGKKGSYYVARISKKTGRYYRKYLKHEE